MGPGGMPPQPPGMPPASMPYGQPGGGMPPGPPYMGMQPQGMAPAGMPSGHPGTAQPNMNFGPPGMPPQMGMPPGPPVTGQPNMPFAPPGMSTQPQGIPPGGMPQPGGMLQPGGIHPSGGMTLPGGMPPGPPGSDQPNMPFLPPGMNMQPQGMAPGGMPPQGGMPPGPGQPNMPFGPPGMLGPPQMPPGPPGMMPGGAPGMQRPQQKLDSSAMPSMVEVVQRDQAEHGFDPFQTGFTEAVLPPLATTDFTAYDTGNANPKFIRSSVYTIPASNDMIKSSQLPITISLTPFSELNQNELQPPIVDLGELGPIRCQRCKAYISSFMEFIDGGRRFRCPFCHATTPVEDAYFAHLDHTGKRTDVQQRPELMYGSYEFVATKAYCSNNLLPQEPAFVFLLDVSYISVRSGLLDTFCSNILEILKELPKDLNQPKATIKIALATYDQQIHFYDLSSSSQTHMCVVSDIEDVFVPFVEGFFVDYETATVNLERCLRDIKQTFADTRVTETILGPTIKVGLEALKAGRRSGKLFVFHTNLPTVEAPGKLKNREDRKLLGSDKEKQVLSPGTEYYSHLAEECVKSGVGVDLFLFPNAHIDLASIAPAATITGGSIYKYQYFDAHRDGKRFLADLRRAVSRPVAFDVMMRVRTSTGIRPTGFFGAFFMQNVTAIEMGTIDADKSLQVEIKYDDKLNENDRAYIQVATLFTSPGGQRRLRVQNLTLKVTADHIELFKYVDHNAVVTHLFKHCEKIVREQSPKDMRDEIINISAKILAGYREKCSEGSPIGQLILPEALKLLPLFACCISKSDALVAGGEITVDDRAWMMHLVRSMKPEEVTRFLYPFVYPLTQINVESLSDRLPVNVRASMQYFQATESYLVDNGMVAFIWIGPEVNKEWLQNVFGVHSLENLDSEKSEIAQRDNPDSAALHMLLDKLNKRRARMLKLVIIKPGDALESWMKKFLVEDRYGQNISLNSVPQYVTNHLKRINVFKEVSDSSLCVLSIKSKCPNDYELFEDYCYKPFTETKSFDDARRRCQQDGGELPKVESDSVNNKLAGNTHAVLDHGTYAGYWKSVGSAESHSFVCQISAF
ncbi:unnamed protein product [Bursaphelenchus okinawaensis]|uniref:Uncharacterized protein n=1 Tax=Bursaphelenchus okinawaensis TaxID=465554 RepID=A0A811JTE5_9BILA|nr:unnamed protein product [Bursaphelenchus okinawaensis]CAG9081652.1 unnamed protein product [Bursaphelenchus okinawaensis]